MLQKASCPLSHTHTCTPTVFFLFGETALATKDYLLSYCITKICFEQILTILYLHMAKLTAQKNGYTLIEKTKKKRLHLQYTCRSASLDSSDMHSKREKGYTVCTHKKSDK